MQRTRLNTLVEVTQTKFNETFSNPWRRISLSLISVLLGFLLAKLFLLQQDNRLIGILL